jgi:hypothetical protein
LVSRFGISTRLEQVVEVGPKPGSGNDRVDLAGLLEQLERQRSSYRRSAV